MTDRLPDPAMNERLLNRAIEEIDKELRRIAHENPFTEMRYGIPAWTADVMNKAVTFEKFGDDADDLNEAVEDLRQEQGEIFLSMMVQAFHDESMCFSTWSLPSGVTAYLVDGWNGEPALFAIDEDGFSDERAAGLVSNFFRSIYIDRDPEPDGPEVLGISIYDVEVYLETRTPELDLLVKSGEL